MWNQIKAWLKRRFGKKKESKPFSKTITDNTVIAEHIIQKDVEFPVVFQPSFPYIHDKKDYPMTITELRETPLKEILDKNKETEDDDRLRELKNIWGVPKIKKRKTRDHFRSPKASQHTKSIGKHMKGKGGKQLKSNRRTMLQHKKISSLEDD